MTFVTLCFKCKHFEWAFTDPKRAEEQMQNHNLERHGDEGFYETFVIDNALTQESNITVHSLHGKARAQYIQFIKNKYIDLIYFKCLQQAAHPKSAHLIPVSSFTKFIDWDKLREFFPESPINQIYVRPENQKTNYEKLFDKTKLLNREQLLCLANELVKGDDAVPFWLRVTEKPFPSISFLPLMGENELREIIAYIQLGSYENSNDRIVRSAIAQDINRFKGRQKGRAYISY